MSLSPAPEKRADLLVILILLPVVVAVGAWLRWQYATTISPYIDEFTTLWAARQTLAQGVPLMPSGVLYTRGLLDTYLIAAFIALSDTMLMARLPSLFISLATIVIIFLMGRREWHLGVGAISALAFALLPEAIVWGARARFYAPLTLFALLTVWLAYRTATAPRVGRGLALSFATAFIVALFLQEETVLLYPPIVLGLVGWRGRSLWRMRPLLWAHLACILAIGVRYAIEIVGQPGYFETIQAERPYVGLTFDVPGTWRTYDDLFLAPDRLLWTLGFMVAVGLAGVAWRRAGGRVTALPAPHQATLFFALVFLSVLAIILFFVGETWRDSRYLVFVQPLWLLAGVAGMVMTVQFIIGRSRTSLQAIAVFIVSIALFTPYMLRVVLPAARAPLTQQQEGYDLALSYLAQRVQPDDVVLTPQPPACAVYLGPCDYYALQAGYEEYVIRRNGQWIDRWTGIPLLNDTATLQSVIAAAPRTWLVIDGLRLASRYEADYLQTIIQDFEIVWDERGVVVLKAEGIQPAFPPTASATPAQPLGPLTLTAWQVGTVRAGAPLPLLLYWQANAPIDRQYNTFVHLIGPDGQKVAQDDGPPARAMIPTYLFGEQPLPDYKTLNLPAALPDGFYRLDVGGYDADLNPIADSYAFTWIYVGTPPVPTLPTPLTLDNGIVLQGIEAVPATARAGDTIEVNLVWGTADTVTGDYTAFVHLLAADGTLITQSDHAPLNGFYPANRWSARHLIRDKHTLTIPATAPAGTYTLVTGWYDPDTSTRALWPDGNDTHTIGTLTIP